MTASDLLGQLAADLYLAGGVEVTPLTPWVGADVDGVDLGGTIDDATFDAVYRAWLDHGVLRFRGQRLTEIDLLRFSRLFGDLDTYVHPNPVAEDPYPEVFIVSNIVEDGRPIGQLGSDAAPWHTDMSFIEIPPKMSTLYGVEVTQEGGETGFLSMGHAYETLPRDLLARIEGRTIKQDFGYTLEGVLRPQLDARAFADPSTSAGPSHPIVRTHPESERKCLYLGKRAHAYVNGCTLEESEDILDALWSHATRDEFAWFNIWQPGDFLMWDNRSCLHIRNRFGADTRRILHRTQVKGDEAPF
jgi:taurine dioxygenase